MASRITVADLSEHLSDVLRRVRDRGEEFVVEQDGESIATLAPSVLEQGPTLRELAARLGDLRLPGDDFGADLATIQASQPRADLGD
jgi:antitoxin (DNA-binding transcriptional repressor) of toxin-antitoxin stability system